MTLFPELKIGLLNGWLPLAFLYLLFGFLLARFPKPVVRRLYDKSGWNKDKVPFIVIGKIIGVAALGLIIFAPLAIGSPWLYAGGVIYALGLTGFIVALFNYEAAPLDKPITKGLYRISRNPQIVGLTLAFLGIGLAVGSGTIVILLLAAQAFHYLFLIREEERSCLAQYGDAYRDYMARTPRYLLFF